MTRKWPIAIAVTILAVIGVLAGVVLYRHAQAVREIDREWEARTVPPLGDIGTTRTLEILPLVDWHAAREELATDMGVSYLVKTDTTTILFDTGNNTAEADPAPLVANMKALGVELDQIDVVVISHAHFDHIGGKRWSDGAISGTTFGIGNTQPDLGERPLIVPIDMTYPGATPQTATDPVRLAPGVATTGTIPRKLFGGRIDEQALAVNVEGKGIVLIVGCNHQTLQRLIPHTERIFDAPLYGVVGGLHYPVPAGRMKLLGLNVQRRLASGDGPLDPLSAEDVDAELALLEEREVGIVAIGGHDSSDTVIADAARRFSAAYRPLLVGSPIRVSSE